MNNLSRAAKLYIMSVILVGGAGTIWYISQVSFAHPYALAFACVLATIFQIFKFEGATTRSSYNLSWVVYGATFAGLGAPNMLLTILFAHLGEWLWHRYPWYIQSFNISAFAVASTVSGLTYWAVNSLPYDFFGLRQAAAIVMAMAIFTFLNHLLVGLVIKWARGQSLSQSGVFTLTTLTIDFGLLCLGASAALVVQVNPAAGIFIVVVAYLVQSALRVPALERKSETDSKTGLYNAQHFDQAVQRELLRAQKQDRPVAVVMADLDRLRDLNNTYGHLAGDAVLKKIAQILQALARDNDVVSRFGGEEFGILLPDTTAEEAFTQVEAMRKAIEAAEFTVTTSETPIKATMSFGVAGRIGTEQTGKEFIHCADIAVYHAKHTGRNRVCTYHPELDSLSPEVALTTPQPVADDAATGPVVAPAPHAVAVRAPDPAPVEQPMVLPATEAPAPTVDAAAPTPADARSVQMYVGAVAVVAALLTLFNLFPAAEVDWVGLLVFVALAIILELVATEIYSRDTSVSTSVAPIIGGMMAFGVLGAVANGLGVALITQIRSRKPINRFVFNISNHLISSGLCLLVLRFIPTPLNDWSIPLQFGFAVAAGCIIYLGSTGLLTGVLHLSTGQPFFHIWQERFKWLGLHYVALGVIAFVLFYTYLIIGPFTVFVLLVPLAMLNFSQRQYIKATKTMVEQLHATNQSLMKRSAEVQHLNEELLLALASTIDLRDPFVVEHSRHVARYAALMAEQLGFDAARVHLVYQAGLIHDIGKLAIPEAILFKPGRLTNDEYEVIKEHVTVGADLLDDFQSLQSVAKFVRHHHERYDGRGYPDRLAGEDIPIEARILALADAVEAMASDRPYRKGSSVEAILTEIEKEAGGQFDPAIVEAFARILRTEGQETIVNSARNVELPELKSNAALREETATWTVPAPLRHKPEGRDFSGNQPLPNPSA